MKRPIPRKQISIVRLEMVREGRGIFVMRRFSNAAVAAEMIRPLIKNRDRELLLVMSLDSKLQPMALEIVAVGGVSSCVVDIRNLFKHALLSNASYIICLHNHPSGIVEVSHEDIQVTKRIQAAGEILGVRLLDHIIVSDDSYYSLRESGELTGELSDNGMMTSCVASAG